jgi:hypothetical protein
MSYAPLLCNEFNELLKNSYTNYIELKNNINTETDLNVLYEYEKLVNSSQGKMCNQLTSLILKKIRILKFQRLNIDDKLDCIYQLLMQTRNDLKYINM